jgi:hypothetical protein
MNSQLKATALMLVLLGSLVGLTACAKYPVVTQSGAPVPAAASAQPAR